MSLDQTSFDPGLTEKYTGELHRAIEKDGSFNVRMSGAGLNNFHFYRFLINLSWPQFFLMILLGYILINSLFACLYLLAGIKNIVGGDARTPMSAFLSTFFLSVHTFTTVGYGTIAPNNFWTNVIASFEALTGLMGLALATGLLYGRFSRPSAKIVYSDRAVIAPYRGKTSLQFRIANRRTNTLMEIEAKMLLMTVSGTGDNHKRKYHVLNLERPSVYFLPLTWTVVHPIDEQSPLFGKTLSDLSDSQAEILILIKAFDDTFGQFVHSRYSYRFDEILWGAKFVPAFSVTKDGDMALELNKLNEVYEVEI
ncbi:MAG TPA: ion channel [Candidatus Acidoferrales bacterium]|nr:ion channel [Candidatus Acidoferrales bacterium]